MPKTIVFNTYLMISYYEKVIKGIKMLKLAEGLELETDKVMFKNIKKAFGKDKGKAKKFLIYQQKQIKEQKLLD